MISPNDAYHNLMLLFGVWSLYGMFRYHVFYKLYNVFTTPSAEFRKIRVFLNRRLQKPTRLCGYHTGAYLRVGMLAVLDSDNCEICVEETKLEKRV